MRSRIILCTALCFLLTAAGPVGAEEPVFQDSEEEIVNALSAEPEAPRTRGLTRGLSIDKDRLPQCRTVVVKACEGSQVVEETVTVDTNPSGARANLKIGFDYDSYLIRRDAYALLNELGKALTSRKLQGQAFYVNGHTDADGPAAYNLDLSLKRAQAVKNYLVGRFDVPQNRLNVRGYGEAMPLVPNPVPDKKVLNRRVEIRPAE